MRSRLKRVRERKKRINLVPVGAAGIIAMLLALFLWKYPLIAEQKKQYVVKSGGEVEKVPVASPEAEVKKTVLEKMVESPKDNKDIVAGNEFAKVGVLDYYPGGYRVTYPDGFVISYSPSLFEAKSPSGGKVIVKISDGSFNVETDLSGTASDQQSVIKTAARLISNSFSFISGAGYEPKNAQERFSN